MLRIVQGAGEDRKLNPANGWGDADRALQWLREVADICRRHPLSVVGVCK